MALTSVELRYEQLYQVETIESYEATQQQVKYYPLKRAFDLIAALFILLLISPLFGIIALAIKLDSSGPVFFVQKRVGSRLQKQGTDWFWKRIEFPCYKFRTMFCNVDSSVHKAYMQAFIHNDTQEMASVQGKASQVRKLVQDPRITRVGRLLRKTSMDELPQFLNVVLGEMSLVGPRPAIPYEVEMYQPWHYQRLTARPGITGLWQVTARCKADFDESVELDIQYAQNQSFLLDLLILFKTPWAVLSTKGAY